MLASLPVGFETPMLTHAMLGEQNPYYARYVGITDSDLKAVQQITRLLYERSLLLYQTFRNRQLPSELNSSIPISSSLQASARQNCLTVDNIHSGDRMILKGYNARYQQPVIYTNAHIEGYWKHTQTLSVCVEPKLICISLEENTRINSVAAGEYWLEVESSRVRYCGIGKKLFLYQGENSRQPDPGHMGSDRQVSPEYYTGYNYYRSHLLISGWVSVFEYENREKIF